jgi:uroporphyrinogen decarboxylase
MQVEAGAEVVKIFDSWAGSLKGEDFDRYALEPAKRIIAELKARHPGLPIIAFPREAGDGYIGFAKATGADCVALDNSVTPTGRRARAGRRLRAGQPRVLAHGHRRRGAGRRDPRIVEAFSNGPHIFNLGHGITPDADPENVQLMIDTVRPFRHRRQAHQHRLGLWPVSSPNLVPRS